MAEYEDVPEYEYEIDGEENKDNHNQKYPPNRNSLQI